jgi:NAD(P)H-hydrate epimerase
MTYPHPAASSPLSDRDWIDTVVVTAAQMSAIESRLFEAGMPVAALMEKVAGRIADRIQQDYPAATVKQVGVLAGPGHNGGDALVVARELFFRGYAVQVHCPLDKGKSLTLAHRQYVDSLGIPMVSDKAALVSCDVVIDGLFGFGLTRPIEGAIAEFVDWLNQQSNSIISIDLPSGIHTDTGAVLGTAIRARQTLCLGLWKAACFQDVALDYLGIVDRLDFDIPIADIQAVVGAKPNVRRITIPEALRGLPPLSPTTHKYRQGHALLVCGSKTYVGAAILAGLGARGSGVGMLSIAVPESLHHLVVSQIPDALVIPCPEDETGAIAQFPDRIQWSTYDAIAAGPGLTPQAKPVIQQLLEAPVPLLLDADGLNILATLGTVSALNQRSQPTILTPHPGEFKRLFPHRSDQLSDRITVTQQAAQETGAIILLKGARVAIAAAQQVWINPHSTPALARGGSGDVLTGLAAGILAQSTVDVLSAIKTATLWHAYAGRSAAHHRSDRGVDAFTLTQFLAPTLHTLSNSLGSTKMV